MPDSNDEAIDKNHDAGSAKNETPNIVSDPSAVNQEKENKNMEIHHHPSHSHQKGSWKLYLREFLMLFLAVFCGSLAEYQLEHKIERDREKQFILTLIEDLKADTSNLTGVIYKFGLQQLKIDTVLRMYDKLTSGYNDTLFRNLFFAIGYPDFVYTDRTIQQLKNSGAMRLIHNQSAANAIVAYDSDMRELTESSDPTLNHILINSLIPMWFEIIDQKEYLTDIENMSGNQMIKENKRYLLQTDKVTLGKFYNCLLSFKTISLQMKYEENELKNKAASLISLLKKEYKLD